MIRKAVIFIFLILASPVAAQLPQSMSYQGVLTDDGGLPLPDGSHTLVVKLYGGALTTTALWTETRSVTTALGVFDVILGEINPLILAFDQPYWLGVAVDGGPELSPRQALSASPYSLNSRDVADGSVGSGEIVDGATVRSLNGLTEAVQILGNGGIAVNVAGNDIVIDGGGGGGSDSDWLINGSDMSSVPVGNVGVGTSIPAAKLHVYSNTGGTSVRVEDAGSFNVSGEVVAIRAEAGGIPLAQEISLRALSTETDVRILATKSTFIEADDYLIAKVAGDDRLIMNGTSTLIQDGLKCLNDAALTTIEIDAQEGNATQGATIKLYNELGELTLELDADHGSSNKGRVIADVIEITGGADLSENFTIAGSLESPEPGYVVSIDPDRPGSLAVSTSAYDRKVAGVMSGAGGIQTGMLMGQSGSIAQGEHPVALSGRVYCWADASEAPIAPGDLLTSAETPGHARKVTDHQRALGAILGKAMTGLDSGKGLVLVLVSLQ